MDSQTIYFPFVRPPHLGADHLVLEHAAELHRQGFNVRVLYLSDDGGHSKFTLPVCLKKDHVLRDRDIYALGDLPFAVLSPLRVLNCVRLSLNNSLLRLEAFPTASAINTYPFAAIVAPSEFAARRLRELGVTHELKSLHPMVPLDFKPAEKTLQIVYRPNYRDAELRDLRGEFVAVYPRFASVPWIPLIGLTRGDCAALLARSAVYAALPQVDSVALTTLEAMASGCRVVGYSGLGGGDFVGGAGGAWITEGDHVSFCRKLLEACQDALREGVALSTVAQMPVAPEPSREETAKLFQHGVAALYTGYMGADPARFLR